MKLTLIQKLMLAAGGVMLYSSVKAGGSRPGYSNIPEEELEDIGADKPGTAYPQLPSDPKPFAAWPLKQGSKGTAVRQLQQMLAATGIPTSTDGVYGGGTSASVKLFQKLYGLHQDGVVGDHTWNRLKEVSGRGRAGATGETLYRADMARDGAAAAAALKTLSNVPDYSAASAVFGELTDRSAFHYFKKRTLVSGMYLSFGQTAHWPAMQTEFRRIGLKQDTSGKWSLSGFALLPQLL